MHIISKYFLQIGKFHVTMDARLKLDHLNDFLDLTWLLGCNVKLIEVVS